MTLLWLVCMWVLFAVYLIKLLLAEEQDHDDYLSANYSGLLITILTAFSCGLTYSHLKKQSLNNIRPQNRAQEIRTSQELQFLSTTIIISSIVIICFCFFAFFDTTSSILTFRGISKNNGPLAVKITSHVLDLLFYQNFAVNPIIYVLRLPNYRKTFSKLYSKRVNSR